MNNGVTNNRNLDLEILTKLEVGNLPNICLLNKYEYSLCQGQELWRRKIEVDFPGLASFKLDDISDKDYYLFVVYRPELMLRLLVLGSNNQAELKTMLDIFEKLSDNNELYEIASKYYQLYYGNSKDTADVSKINQFQRYMNQEMIEYIVSWAKNTDTFDFGDEISLRYLLKFKPNFTRDISWSLTYTERLKLWQLVLKIGLKIDQFSVDETYYEFLKQERKCIVEKDEINPLSDPQIQTLDQHGYKISQTFFDQIIADISNVSPDVDYKDYFETAINQGVKINSESLEKLIIQLNTTYNAVMQYQVKSLTITSIVKNLWLLIKLFRQYAIPIDPQLIQAINNLDWFNIDQYLIL